ncbi:serine hydrolase domain-containing protein [soil metagenome]
MSRLEPQIDAIAAETGFAGVVRVDDAGGVRLAKAYGLAHRGYRIPNTVDTRFGIASGSKALTALAVVSLIEDGVLELGTTARSVLGADLPLIGADVTVEHLLAHRSGIGDYLDEDQIGDISDYLMPVGVHELATTEQFVRVLDGYPTKFAPDEQFSYCNGGYVVLALIAERCGGATYHDLVRQRVCRPAGMDRTDFLRTDELGADAARGYLSVDGPRTNIFHLPVVATGDGGAYSTAADIHALWTALYAGTIVAPSWFAEMVRPRSYCPSESLRYGLGFWLHESGDAVILEGWDAGVSSRTVHDPIAHRTYTVLSNTSEGAWPIARRLDELLSP